MDRQVCHCGWSKVTTLQGLWCHQIMNGCLPNRLSESEQVRFKRMVSMLTFRGPQLSLTDPIMDRLHSSNRAVPSSPRIMVLDDLPQEENQPRDNTSSNREMVPFSDTRARRLPESTPQIGLDPQLISLAALIEAGEKTPPESPSASPPPEAREAQTPQMTKSFADALQVGSNSAAVSGPCDNASDPPSGQAPSMNSGKQISGNQTNPVNTEANVEKSNPTPFQTGSKVFGEAAGAPIFVFGSQQSSPTVSATKISGNQTNPANKENKTETTSQGLMSETPQKVTDTATGVNAQQNVSPNPSTPTSAPKPPMAREAQTPQMTQASADATLHETTSDPPSGQAPSVISGTQISGNQTNPVKTEGNDEKSNPTSFETGSKGFSEASGASSSIFGSQQSSPTVSATKISGNQTNPTNKENKTETTNHAVSETPQKVKDAATAAGAQQNVSPNSSTPTSSTKPPMAREALTPKMTQASADATPHKTASDALSGQAPSMFTGLQIPASTEVNTETTNKTLPLTSSQVFGTASSPFNFSFSAQKNGFPNTSTPIKPPITPETREAETPQTTQSFADSLQLGSNSKRDSGTPVTTSAAQSSPTVSGTKISGNQTNPSSKENKTDTRNQTLLETPQKLDTATSNGARRALDFSTGTKQNVSPNPFTPMNPPRIPEAREAETPKMTETFADSLQTGSKSTVDAGPQSSTSSSLLGQTPSIFSGTKSFGNQTNLANSGMSNQTFIQTMQKGFRPAPGANAFTFGAQQNYFPNSFTQTSSPRIPEAREAQTAQSTQTFTDSLQLGSNSNKGFGTHDMASSTQFSWTEPEDSSRPLFCQSPHTVSGTKISGNQTNPANKENKTKTNQTMFQPSQKVADTADGGHQELDFSAGTQQTESWNIPTTTAQETVIRMKKKEKDRAKPCSNLYTGAPGEVPCDVCTKPKLRAEKSCLMCVTSYCSTHLENHSATQRLKGHKLVDPVANLDERACLQHGRPLELFSRKAGRCICVLCMKKGQEVIPIEEECNRRKAKLENTKLDLREKIEKRITRIDEINESLKCCEDQLDDEESDIDAVFTAVMAIVEEAYAKALKPLKDRRQLVVQEARDIEEKLEAEIEELEQSISVLEDISALEDHILFLQTYPSLRDQDDIKDCPEGELDTSLSFGTLRKITGTMLGSIQQELKKLTPIELQRIPEFTVDVTLDPTTAHQCLKISDDGKEVKDSGKTQKTRDSLERFDMHGSVLGLNRFTSGKSYWEVKVGNKTGWDLGVARGRANRKGKLSLTPDNGYWVTVHFDDGKYAALTVPPVALPLEEKPRTVGVFVDYEEGLVSFYDVTAKSHIYSFTGCSFSGEILPYFSPHVKIGGKNGDPLVISSSKKM